MSTLRISYRRYLDVSRKHSAVAYRTPNGPRARATIAFSNDVPLTDDHFDLSQTRNEVLLTIAHELFARVAPLRLAVQNIRTTSADRSEILGAIDAIDFEIARIASLAEDLIAATCFQAKGLPT